MLWMRRTPRELSIATSSPATSSSPNRESSFLTLALQNKSGPLKDAEVTRSITRDGQIVGTLNYMSPEQLQGKETDTQTDIFSFGLVFWEMLTGKLAFDGTSAASVIAAILEREAPSVAQVAPSSIDRVLRRCLAKDPEQGWQSARDLKSALELAAEAQGPTRGRKTPQLAWIIAAASVIATIVGFWSARQKPLVEEQSLQFRIVPPPGAELLIGPGGGSTISPDGRTVAFLATSGGSPKLWLRPLDSLEARELAGTEGAQFPFGCQTRSQFVSFQIASFSDWISVVVLRCP
jgi:eukaryotic-like serine/threonine-protein kinase